MPIAPEHLVGLIERVTFHNAEIAQSAVILT